MEPLPLALNAYAGTYHDAAYGSITLCAPTSPSQSEHCTRILDDFSSLGPLSSTTLYAAWPRVWSSHVRLVHAENNTNKFDISFTALFPDGYGASNTPFETYESDAYEGQVEFVLDEKSKSVMGFGYFGRGDMQGVREEGVSVQDGAIAWFEKV